MKAWALQMDIDWEDKPASYARVERLLGQAALEPGDLVVLPEMFATGFSMNLAATAEPEGGPTEQFLRKLARERGVNVVGGLVTFTGAGRGLNQSLAIDPTGAVAGRYTKIFPFSGGGELGSHDAGSEVEVVDFAGFKTALFICYDLRFPEIFREAVRKGAELMVVIAAWPSRRVAHWTCLLQARAIENMAVVVGVNRSGVDPNLPYPGRSLIVDQMGAVMADAGDRESVAGATLDRAALLEWREAFPALRDMRPACG
jgi:omega-amidase